VAKGGGGQMTELQKKILKLYGARHFSDNSEYLTSEEVANTLGKTKIKINDELVKLEDMGALVIMKSSHGNFSPTITTFGLRVLDDIALISDK